jgi:hypothetical protein
MHGSSFAAKPPAITMIAAERRGKAAVHDLRKRNPSDGEILLLAVLQFTAMTGNIWTLNPSSLTFLWEECPRCFYLEVARSFRRPRAPMPKIFTKIDEEMRRHFHQRRTEEILPELPRGVLDTTEYRVESAPLRIPGHVTACTIRGKMDCIARFDDGSFAVIDFKTSEQRANHVPFYGRQLHAYAAAMENPAPGKPLMSPVKRLGLVVFEPDAFAREASSRAILSGRLAWLEVRKEEEQFRRFLGSVLEVLEQPSPPTPGDGCPYCAYREASRKNGI